MAKPSWLVLDKTSGTGNGTVKASAAQFWGRVNRTGSIVVTSTKDTSKKQTVNVTNTAHAEFLTLDKDTTEVISTATQVSFASDQNGNLNQTNCKYLCAKGEGGITDIDIRWKSGTVGPLSEYEQIDSKFITNNSDGSITFEFPNDPGATDRIDIIIDAAFPANETISDKRYTVEIGGISSAKPTKLTDIAATQGSCQITQTAKVVKLSVSPTSITIPAAGTAQTITVTSNDAWTIS